MRKDVQSFIKNFSEAQDTFLYGCCYWFAFILKERFGATIYYDPIDNHFVAKIGRSFYDVSGEVHGENYMPWDEYEAFDAFSYRSVVKHCIRKE